MTTLGRQWTPPPLPTELYHGTSRHIQGGMIMPAGRNSGESHFGSTGEQFGQRSDEHAFGTETEDNAWDWARNAAMANAYKSDDIPRMRVYKLDPAGAPDLAPGVFHPKHVAPVAGEAGFPEWVSRHGIPVEHSIDIKPGHQGTFPQENWNKYRSGEFWMHEANHPSPEEHRNEMDDRALPADPHNPGKPPGSGPVRDMAGQTMLPLGLQWRAQGGGY